MKELTSKSREIARAILFAQLASDGGKGIYDLLNEVDCKGAEKCFRRGYCAKDSNILKAIDLINRQGSEEVRYSVIHTGDQNGYESSLIYFAFRIDGVRFQVSFHSPADWGRPVYSRYYRNSCKTHWDKASSRESCYALAVRYGWA